MAQPQSKVVAFVNWSREDFTHSWDSVPYTFKSGEKVYMEEWKANHFALHLANRELIRDGCEGDTSPKFVNGKYENENFILYFNRAIADASASDVTEKVKDEVIKKNIEMGKEKSVQEKRASNLEKARAAKKEKAKAMDEEEFEGLKK